MIILLILLILICCFCSSCACFNWPYDFDTFLNGTFRQFKVQNPITGGSSAISNLFNSIKF